MSEIHPTAVIDPSAEIGAGVSVGPFTVIGPNVAIGEGARIASHVLIERNTRLGRNVLVSKGAVLGTDPQDLKYRGEPTDLIVGDNTVIREFASLNRGTAAHGRTEVGRDCLLMSYSHVAHDCVIGDNVIVSNAVNMGGHVSIQDYATVGGMTAIHQFVRVGTHAFVGGASRVQKDVPPYVKAAGSPIELYGLNSVGLQRRGFPEEVRRELKRAYKLFFYSDLNVTQALERARLELRPFTEVQRFLAFIEESERGILV